MRAVVVLRRGYEPSAELRGVLQAHVKATTAPYKYPRQIDFVDQLPKTTTGKIKRAALRTQIGNAPSPTKFQRSKNAGH